MNRFAKINVISIKNVNDSMRTSLHCNAGATILPLASQMHRYLCWMDDFVFCMWYSLSYKEIRQKRTFDTPCPQSSYINAWYDSIKQIKVTPTGQSVGIKKPGSIEILCSTFQTKVAKIWDETLTQSAHLCNPCLAIYIEVGYTF